MPKQVGSSHEWVFEPKEIEQVGMLIEYGLTVAQIAAIMGVSKATMERNLQEEQFAEGVLKARGSVASSLINHAYKRAKEGSDSVLIFLLKTKCGFSEKRIHEIITDGEKPVLNINLLAGEKKS